MATPARHRRDTATYEDRGHATRERRRPAREVPLVRGFRRVALEERDRPAVGEELELHFGAPEHCVFFFSSWVRRNKSIYAPNQRVAFTRGENLSINQCLRRRDDGVQVQFNDRLRSRANFVRGFDPTRRTLASQITHGRMRDISPIAQST